MSQHLTLPQKQEIVSLLNEGLSRNEIAVKLRINWRQVDYWGKNKARVAELAYASDFFELLDSSGISLKSDDFGHTGSTPVSCTKQQYVYLLGCYLGDGYINAQGEYTWKFQVACDAKYPNVIEQIANSMAEVFGNTANTYRGNLSNCVTVYTHSNLLPTAFPQHGGGHKHDRPIILTDQQRRFIEEFPWEFVRGLYHTDGSRYLHRQNGYEYVKYNFTNRSRDIANLFCWACDLVGVKYNTFERQVTSSSLSTGSLWTVTIGRKSEVEKCEQYLGPK